MEIKLISSKKIICLLGLFLFLAFNNLSEATAQIVVKVRPAQPKVVVARPKKTRSGHIWIAGHWRYNGNRYVWQKATWVKARTGHNWIAGTWETCNGGYRWVAGYWAPVRVQRAAPQRVVVVRNQQRNRKRRNAHRHR